MRRAKTGQREMHALRAGRTALPSWSGVNLVHRLGQPPLAPVHASGTLHVSPQAEHFEPVQTPAQASWQSGAVAPARTKTRRTAPQGLHASPTAASRLRRSLIVRHGPS